MLTGTPGLALVAMIFALLALAYLAADTVLGGE